MCITPALRIHRCAAFPHWPAQTQHCFFHIHGWPLLQIITKSHTVRHTHIRLRTFYNAAGLEPDMRLLLVCMYLWCFENVVAFFFYRCKELPKGSSGQHYHSSCWGTINLHTLLMVFALVLFSSTFPHRQLLCLRSSQSQRTWCHGFYPKLLSQLQMRWVALCSACPPSAKMELCRYVHMSTNTARAFFHS